MDLLDNYSFMIHARMRALQMRGISAEKVPTEVTILNLFFRGVCCVKYDMAMSSNS
jgi:hypothetical protein